MKRSSVLVLALVVLLGAGSLAWFFLIPRHSLPQDLLQAVPADAYGVLRIDVPAVLNSEAYKRLVVEQDGARGIQRVTQTCGFNPLERLKELVVFARPAPQGLRPEFAFIARGDLPHDDLIECVKKVGGGGSDAKLKRDDIDGIPTVVSTGGASRAGFVGSDGIIGGDSESVRAIINAIVGKAPGLGADSILRDLYNQVSGGTDLALVARMPDEVKPLLLVLAAKAGGSAELASLAELRALSANASFASGKITGGAVLLTSDAARATGLVELVRAQVQRVLSIPGVSLTPAAGVLRGIQMEATGDRATFTGSVKVSTVEALFELLPALEQLQGAFAPQGNAQQPTPTNAGDAGVPAPVADAGAPPVEAESAKKPAKPAKKAAAKKSDKPATPTP